MKTIVIVLLGLAITNGFPSSRSSQNISQPAFPYPPALPEREAFPTETFPYPSYSEADTTPEAISIPIPEIKTPELTTSASLVNTENVEPENIKFETFTSKKKVENSLDVAKENNLNQAPQIEVLDKTNGIYDSPIQENKELTTVINVHPLEISVTTVPVEFDQLPTEVHKKDQSSNKVEPNEVDVVSATKYGPPTKTNSTYFSSEYSSPYKLDANISTVLSNHSSEVKPIEFSYKYAISNITYPYPATQYDLLQHELKVLAPDNNLPKQTINYAYTDGNDDASPKEEIIPFSYENKISTTEPASFAETTPVEFSYEYAIPATNVVYSSAEYGLPQKEVNYPAPVYSLPKHNITFAYPAADYNSPHEEKTVNLSYEYQLFTISPAVSAKTNPVEFSYEYAIPAANVAYHSIEHSFPENKVFNLSAKKNNLSKIEYTNVVNFQNSFSEQIKSIETSYEYTIPNKIEYHPALEYEKKESNVFDTQNDFSKKVVPLEFSSKSSVFVPFSTYGLPNQEEVDVPAVVYQTPIKVNTIPVFGEANVAHSQDLEFAYFYNIPSTKNQVSPLDAVQEALKYENSKPIDSHIPEASSIVPHKIYGVPTL